MVRIKNYNSPTDGFFPWVRTNQPPTSLLRLQNFPRGLGKGSDAGGVGAWLETVLARLSVDDVPAPWKQTLLGLCPGDLQLYPNYLNFLLLPFSLGILQRAVCSGEMGYCCNWQFFSNPLQWWYVAEPGRGSICYGEWLEQHRP